MAALLALLANMNGSADNAEADPYQLMLNNGQIVVSKDDAAFLWQTPHDGEGAL